MCVHRLLKGVLYDVSQKNLFLEKGMLKGLPIR